MELDDNIPDLVKGLVNPADIDPAVLGAGLAVGIIKQAIQQNQENKAYEEQLHTEAANENIMLDAAKNQTPPPQSADTIAQNAAFEESYKLAAADAANAGFQPKLLTGSARGDAPLLQSSADYAFQRLDAFKQGSDTNKSNKEILDGLNKNIPELIESFKEARGALQQSLTRIAQLNDKSDYGTISAGELGELEGRKASLAQLSTNYDNAKSALEGAQERIAGLTQAISDYSKSEVYLTNAYENALKNLQDNANTINQLTRGIPSGNQSSTIPIQTDTAAVAATIEGLQQSFQTYHETIMEKLNQFNATVQHLTVEVQNLQYQHSNHGP